MNLTMQGVTVDWRAHADALYALVDHPYRCQHRLQKDEGVQSMPCGKCAAIAEYEAAVAKEGG